MNQSQLIDIAERNAGIASDNKLAPAIGCDRAVISNWRHNRRPINEHYATKLAPLAGIPLPEFMAYVQADNAKSKEVKKAFLMLAKMAKKAQGGAVNLSALVLAISPLALAAKGFAVFETAAYCILCLMGRYPKSSAPVT